MDVTAAFVFFVMALPIIGLVSDNYRLRRRNKELDSAGAKLAEEYLRSRSQLLIMATVDPSTREYQEQQDKVFRILAPRRSPWRGQDPVPADLEGKILRDIGLGKMSGEGTLP
jgi:hypothetical protein